jgi:PPOX class probable F420-dependent enzyme
MSIRLTEAEAWATIEAAHTGMLTTLCADGRPVTLPIWFVVSARTICLSTPAAAKKLQRIRRDPRAAFLVESGRHWHRLVGVHVNGNIEEVDEPERTTIRAALEEKYRDFRHRPNALPAAVRARYAESVILRLVPEGRLLTWDNSKIRLD